MTRDSSVAHLILRTNLDIYFLSVLNRQKKRKRKPSYHFLPSQVHTVYWSKNKIKNITRFLFSSSLLLHLHPFIFRLSSPTEDLRIEARNLRRLILLLLLSCYLRGKQTLTLSSYLLQSASVFSSSLYIPLS